MINQLLLTNGQYVRVGNPFPGAGWIDDKGNFVPDQELVRLIVERPVSENDDGDQEPAAYECWVLPQPFEEAMRAQLELERVKSGRELEIRTHGKALTPSPSENLIRSVVEMQEALAAAHPKVMCHKVQHAQVVFASETVPVHEAWEVVAAVLAERFGIKVGADDADEEDEEETPAQQSAAAPS